MVRTTINLSGTRWMSVYDCPRHQLNLHFSHFRSEDLRERQIGVLAINQLINVKVRGGAYMHNHACPSRTACAGLAPACLPC